MGMRYIIDRFEDDMAAVELGDGSMVSLPRAALPPEAREGDVVSVSVDSHETARRKGELKSRVEKLFRQGQTNE